MKRSLINILPFAEAFSKILHPFAEVVVHDLEKDQIEAIFNPLSRREVGDDSYLDRINFGDSETIIGPYEKTNWDGRPMKSISIVARNLEDKAEGFLCINVDVSVFTSANQLLQAFLQNSSEVSKDSQKLFKEDLYENINIYVRNYCLKRQMSIEILGREEKREIIHSLEEEGAFRERNAANYIGRILGISRATVYNYLKKREVSDEISRI